MYTKIVICRKVDQERACEVEGEREREKMRTRGSVINRTAGALYIYVYTIRPKNARNGTGAKGGLFRTLSDQILQLFSPLTSLAHWGCIVEF